MSKAFLNNGAIFDFLRTEEVGCRVLKLSNGNTIFRPNDPATNLYLIESGEVRIFDVRENGREQLLEILGPSEFFGISALGTLVAYGKLAISVGDSQVRVVPGVGLRSALAIHGEFAVQFIELLALRLHNIWTECSAFASDDCRIRLIRKLLWFANSPAAHSVNRGVELRITHAELAQSICSVRETVTICLAGLRNENIVQTGRNRIIYDPDRLRRLVPDSRPTMELAIAG